MKRAIAICKYTMLLFTLGSAAIVTILTWNNPAPEGGCMFPLDGRENAILCGILCGIGGFIVSLIVGPTVAVTDNTVRRLRTKFADQQMQAQNNALSLLRASSVPVTQQKRELLRSTQAGPATPPQELLRAVHTVVTEGDGRRSC